EVLADAATAAGVEIRLGTELVAMDPGDAERPAALDLVGPDGEATTIPADLVWSTAPVAELAARTRPAPPAEVASAIGRLEHRGLVLVYLTLPRSQWTPFDAHYLPATEHLAARVSEPKNYRDSGDDPSDVTVVCAEVPATVGDETWTASDAHLAARLGDDFGRLGLPVVEPAAVTTVRLPKVYPLYRPGFEWDLVALEWWLSANPRLVSFGRQGLFVPDNTHHALVMADAAAASLRADGTFDHGAWGRARAGFHQHVVED
ncbi:MAG: FAD-dependent oxidoreductase, partial [Actinobacteria bacterium]|nr:FAD-dependent oxidoreductase [Actinomycetota bacterium]